VVRVKWAGAVFGAADALVAGDAAVALGDGEDVDGAEVDGAEVDGEADGEVVAAPAAARGALVAAFAPPVGDPEQAASAIPTAATAVSERARFII
jgi:hypothetical protein